MAIMWPTRMITVFARDQHDWYAYGKIIVLSLTGMIHTYCQLFFTVLMIKEFGQIPLVLFVKPCCFCHSPSFIHSSGTLLFDALLSLALAVLCKQIVIGHSPGHCEYLLAFLPEWGRNVSNRKYVHIMLQQPMVSCTHTWNKVFSTDSRVLTDIQSFLLTAAIHLLLLSTSKEGKWNNPSPGFSL